MNPIHLYIKKIADTVNMSYTIKHIPDIFSILSKFLKKAPEKFFFKLTPSVKANKLNAPCIFTKSPLFLSDSGVSAIKSSLNPFKDILSLTSLTDSDSPNLLYIIGQFLANVAAKLQLLETTKPEKFKTIKSHIDAFYKLWNFPHMNAHSLFNFYKGKELPEITSDLISKFDKSTDILKILKRL